MELLFAIMVWPVLVLVLGVVFVSTWDINASLMIPVLVVFIIFALAIRDKFADKSQPRSDERDLEATRRGLIAFSIGLLLPILAKYLLAATNTNLAGIICGLVIGFGVIVWGMFIENYKVITYANIIGGSLVVIYMYSQLWNLGQLAQVIGAAFGLIVAVIISVLKFKDKLV